ncbi:MAG: hypothetical protein ABIJ21_00430 [Nanoarchaeota archaeon]
MNKIPIVGIGALLAFGLIAAGVFAFGGFGHGQDPAVKAAIEAGDYNAYVSAQEATFKKRMPTEDQFNQMKDKYHAMQESQDKIQATMDAGDYTAWKEAMANTPRASRMAEVITADNFVTFVEMHKAMESGDVETARTLADELGLGGFGRGMGFGKENGFGQGFGRGHGFGKGGCPFADKGSAD